MAYLANFVRLTGIIEAVEVSVTDPDTDCINLKADHRGPSIWIVCNLKASPKLRPFRTRWKAGLRVVVLGMLAADDEQIFIEAFALYEEQTYRDSEGRRGG